MKFRPTPEQSAAINESGSILVSAAAGSGKTAVLVERVIKMLTDRENPVYADRLLIVTFTNAAADEMLARIENRLYEELEKNPDDELINKQKHLIKSADICTIDSFCIRLVRDNFALCGIEPDFKVTDDTSLFPIRQNVLNSVISKYLIEMSASFNKLLKISNCGFDETNLLKLVDKLYIYSKKAPFVNQYIDSLKLPYITPFSKEHIWYKYAFLNACDEMKYIKKDISYLAESALFCENYDKATIYAENVSNVVLQIEIALNSNDWDTVVNTVRTADLGRLPSKTAEQFKTARDSIKGGIEHISNIFSRYKDEVQENITELKPAVQLLCEIVTEYSNSLLECLKEKNTFSFDDVEQLAMSMLAYTDEYGNIVKTEQSSEIISRYDEVLVDEFQDVNDLQNMLFEIISDDSRKLFIVGDVKQSIYAFRGSNPDIFLNKKNMYSLNDSKKILLTDNFRSRKGICDSVNFFFENLMTSSLGTLVYDRDEQLTCGAKYPENDDSQTELLIVDKVDDESDETIVESEASAIAQYIKGIMEKGAFLTDKEGNLRSAGYGDFCILLAELKNKSGVIAEKLSEYGIPTKVSDGDFFNSTEIVTVLSILRIANNPRNDIELLRALMSPVYGFTAEEMARVRLCTKESGLYAALSIYAKTDLKAQKFLSDIKEIRRLACIMTVDRLVSYIIDKTDMMNIFYAMADSEVRVENLTLLLKLASEYAGNSGGSVYGFLHYLDSMPKDKIKTTAPFDDSCVKIMSIHRSKGLQFPICIVAGLTGQINKSDTKDSCLFSPEYGISFKYFDKVSFEKKEDLGHVLSVLDNQKRIARERLRLLYVAMTRAEEKLCLVCCLKNASAALLRAAKASDFGKDEISAKFIINSQNSSSYILAAAIMHPDAEVLRKFADCKVDSKTTDSHISVSFADITAPVNAEGLGELDIQPDKMLAERIKENLKYRYPFESLINIPAKTSASNMAESIDRELFDMTDRPSFMEKDGMSATEKGTVLHKIMQYITFEPDTDINAEIKRLVTEKRITEEEAAAVNRAAAERFFATPLYMRILYSKDVRREMRFITELPVSKFSAGAGNFEDTFIVQGAVDLCFAENDGVVVVDFKTDRVDSVEVLKENYEGQLSVYADACEKIFGMPVKEKILYSFHLSDMISF